MKRLRQTASSLALLSAVSGCELVAKFDRDRIHEELPDVGVLFTGDGAVLGGDSDSAVRDAGLFDGATTAPDEDAGELDAGEMDAGDIDAQVDDAGDLDASDGAQADDAHTDAGDAVVPGDADVTDAAAALDAAG